MPPDRAIWEWIDVQGGYLRASSWIAAAANPALLVTALQNASNGVLQIVTVAAPAISAATPVGGQYQSAQDLALFNFQTVPGTKVQLAVPAPQNAVFGANSTVVDPTAPLAAAIIAQALGVLADVAGNPATAYAGGSKASRRTEQP